MIPRMDIPPVRRFKLTAKEERVLEALDFLVETNHQRVADDPRSLPNMNRLQESVMLRNHIENIFREN